MSAARALTLSFAPDALRKYAMLFEDVWHELEQGGVVEAFGDTQMCRTRLAEGVFRLAQTQWTDIQVRQLLARALRNDATRRQRSP